MLDSTSTTITNDPLAQLNLRKLRFVPKNSEKGGWIWDWVIKNSKYKRHVNIRSGIKVKNVWYIERFGDRAKFDKYQKSIVGKVRPDYFSEVLHQGKRYDPIDEELYRKTNTAFLVHGTKSVNVKGILGESFKLPKELSGVPITGALMGSGVYHADLIAKSLGYCSNRNSYWTNGTGEIKGRSSFLFLSNGS